MPASLALTTTSLNRRFPYIPSNFSEPVCFPLRLTDLPPSISKYIRLHNAHLSYQISHISLNNDISSVYSVVASISRLAALTGTYFAIVGIFLVARIPGVERRVGHDRLVMWHRKLGPLSLYLICSHVLFIVLSFAGQDQVLLAVELWRMLANYDWMWPAPAGFVLMVMAAASPLRDIS